MRSTGRFLLGTVGVVSITCLFVFPILFLPIPVHVRSSNPVATQLTSGRWNDTNPVISPSGNVIVFTRNEGNQHDLWMMTSKGTHVSCLVCSKSDKQSPEFSPSGNDLAFLQTEHNGSMDIWAVNMYTHNLLRLTFDNVVKGEFQWSPDGTSLVFDEFRNSTWMISFVGFDDFKTLPVVSMSANCINPSFAENGNELLFSSNMMLNGSVGYHIWALNLQTMKYTALTTGNGNDSHPVMSPDGQRIAFFSDRSGVRTLWTMFSNGTGMSQAVSNPMTIAIPEAAATSVPFWLPDSSGVLYYSAIFDNFSDVYAFYPNINITWTPGTPYLFYQTVGSSLTRLTVGFSVNISPVYDRGTRTIVYASGKAGSSFKIWKISLGPQTPLSPNNPYGQ